MMLAVVVLMIAGVYGQTVGEMIGVYEWHTCTATQKSNNAWKSCLGPPIKDYNCEFAISYDYQGLENNVNMFASLCQRKNVNGRWLFKVQTQINKRHEWN